MDNQKQKQILTTAMKLFNEFGFHATPTSLIAKKAKVSVGTLFNYYPTKNELIHAIYMDIKIHSKLTFLELIEDHKSHHDKLLSMWHAVIIWGINNPEEFAYSELYLHSPFYRELKNEIIMGAYFKFRESILQALSPSTVCQTYPEYSLLYIDNAIHATTNFIIQNNIQDVEEFIQSSFDLMWFGFAQNPNKIKE